jgi:hypothetical protein
MGDGQKPGLDKGFARHPEKQGIRGPNVIEQQAGYWRK